MGAIQNTQSLRILTEEESKHQLIYVFSLQNMICMTVAVSSKYFAHTKVLSGFTSHGREWYGVGGGFYNVTWDSWWMLHNMNSVRQLTSLL